MRKTGKKRQVSSQGPDIYQQMNDKLWLNNIKLEEKPHLTISEWCHKHIKELHKEYPGEEWLALCKTEKRWPWDFYIVDMIHPEQSTSSWAVTATDDGMEWVVKELQERWEDMWAWNCVLHSHHKMWVFWSGTDDNARKSLNDGRFMAFAVVSAYKQNGTDIEVDYKGCVNFYKPYNIEIDCDMYYEEWYLDDDYNKYIDEYMKTRDEIFEEKVKAKQDEMNWLMNQPDYSRVLDYLWLDIKKELDENYQEVVMKKMPNPQVEAILKSCENEAKAEAEEKLKEDKELMDGMAEYSAWTQWSNDLKTQLEEHKKVKAKTYSWWDDYQKALGQDKVFSQSNRFFDDLDYTDDDNDGRGFWFTTKRYPTSEQLRAQLGLRPEVSIIQVNWNWKVYSKSQNRYVFADEFDEEEDWESCFWSEKEIEEHLQNEEDKKKDTKNEREDTKEDIRIRDGEDKTPEELWEDVLHWLYN